MRAELIGRKVEMSQLQEAVENLKQGKGSIFSIVGDAGTGKSRLIEDFKATINLEEIQWREGHAMPTPKHPYFLLVNLLSRAWQVEEGDNPEQVKKKVEAGSGYLIGERNDLIPYVGSLYSIKYPEIENVGPNTGRQGSMRRSSSFSRPSANGHLLSFVLRTSIGQTLRL